MSSAVRPVLHFDHVGIVVKDLSVELPALANLLPITAATRRFDDEQLGVSVQFLRDTSGAVLELIAPLGPASPVAKIAESRSGKINQLAYRVEDLAKAREYFRSNRATPTGAPKPAIAFGGALVQFFLVPGDFIVELIEAHRFDHEFENLTA